METLTSYLGLYRDGYVVTEPPLPDGVKFDAIITIIPDDDPNSRHTPEVTKVLRERLSELILRKQSEGKH